MSYRESPFQQEIFRLRQVILKVHQKLGYCPECEGRAWLDDILSDYTHAPGCSVAAMMSDSHDAAEAEERRLKEAVVETSLAWWLRGPSLVGGVEVVGGSYQKLATDHRDACSALAAFRAGANTGRR